MDSIVSLSAANRVNVPRSVIDPHYRYTMPPMRVKVEGRGKMIKTILLNLSEVAIDVYRPPEYLLHFFSFDMGASFEIDTKEHNHPKYIIRGQRGLSELNDSLDKFIEGFVLCGKCRNPETVISVKRNSVTYRCKACGQSTTPNPGHKLTNYIIKHPIKEETKEEKQQKAKEKQRESDEEEWAADTSDAAIAERASKLAVGSVKDMFQTGNKEEEHEEPVTTTTTTTTATTTVTSTSKPTTPREIVPLTLSPGGDPLALLKKFWNSKPPVESVEELISEFQSQQKYADKIMFNLIFGSLFDATIEKEFAVKADYMKLYVKNHKDQKQLLVCLEKLCQLYSKEILPKLSSILQHYYNADMLDDDIIFDWYDNTLSVSTSDSGKKKKLAQEIAEKSKEFIAWLESDV